MMERPTQQLAGARFRGLLIIWGAQIGSLLVSYVLIRLTPVEARAGDNRAILLALAATALTTFALSFVVKSRLLAQAARERRADLVTTAYVIAFTLSEACAIIGVVAHFTTGAREAFYFLIPAVLGLLLHFPRRRHLEDTGGNPAHDFKTTL